MSSARLHERSPYRIAYEELGNAVRALQLITIEADRLAMKVERLSADVALLRLELSALRGDPS